MTGVATAFRSESPILHIGGQGALTQHKMGSLQDLPHVDMMTPITKFAATVPSTERVADMVSMAAREAFNGAPGPVYLEIPRDILCIAIGKSTYARCGIIVNVTPLEPEWRGKITIEISNTTPLPAKIYAGEGIAQIVFLRAEKVCQTSYGDKRGKYQDQKGLTLPFVQGQNPTGE